MHCQCADPRQEKQHDFAEFVELHILIDRSPAVALWLSHQVCIRNASVTVELSGHVIIGELKMNKAP